MNTITTRGPQRWLRYYRKYVKLQTIKLLENGK